MRLPRLLLQRRRAQDVAQPVISRLLALAGVRYESRWPCLPPLGRGRVAPVQVVRSILSCVDKVSWSVTRSWTRSVVGQASSLSAPNRQDAMNGGARPPSSPDLQWIEIRARRSLAPPGSWEGNTSNIRTRIEAMNQIDTPLPALSPHGGERVTEGRERGASTIPESRVGTMNRGCRAGCSGLLVHRTSQSGVRTRDWEVARTGRQGCLPYVSLLG